MRHRAQIVRVVALLATLAAPATGQRINNTPPITDDPAADSLPAALRRTRVARPSISGAFEVREEIVGRSGLLLGSNWGYLIASNDVGLLALATELDGNRLGRTRVYNVRRWTTNRAGDVALSAGLKYDGYQTEDGGFIAEALVVGEISSQRASLSGVPFDIPLSRNDGLFAVTSRTVFEENGRRAPASQVTEWTGDMAIAFDDSTMYADLMLRNAHGGKAGFFASGPLNGDTFDLRDARGSRLVGTIRNGVVVAEWTDKRPGKVAFVGSLKAERR